MIELLLLFGVIAFVVLVVTSWNDDAVLRAFEELFKLIWKKTSYDSLRFWRPGKTLELKLWEPEFIKMPGGDVIGVVYPYSFSKTFDVDVLMSRTNNLKTYSVDALFSAMKGDDEDADD